MNRVGIISRRWWCRCFEVGGESGKIREDRKKIEAGNNNALEEIAGHPNNGDGTHAATYYTTGKMNIVNTWN